MQERRRIHPVQLGGPFADKTLYGRRCWVHGVSVTETTGTTPAAIRLRDGNDLTGAAVLRYNLAANESTRDWFGDGGISFEGGLFLDVISGACEGTVFVSDDRGGSAVTLDLDNMMED